MLLDRAVKKAKGDEAEKIGMSIKMPVTLKEDLVSLANGNNISTNALICNILDLAINSNEFVEGSIVSDNLRDELSRLKSKKSECVSYYENGIFQDTVDIADFKESLLDEIKSVDKTIKVLSEVV